MATILEKSGRSVTEALDAALAELGVSEKDVQMEVLEEPNKGFLGILGGKMARIRVTYHPPVKKEAIVTPSPVPTVMNKDNFDELDVEERTEEFLTGLLQTLRSRGHVDVHRDVDFVTAEIRGDGLGYLIGRHGQTLDSLQYLTSLVVNKASTEKARIIVDIEGYREKREETLQRLALRLADRVRLSGRPVALEPMNPLERRIIHMTLQNHAFVTTHSEGEDPYRKVVIGLKR